MVLELVVSVRTPYVLARAGMVALAATAAIVAAKIERESGIFMLGVLWVANSIAKAAELWEKKGDLRHET